RQCHEVARARAGVAWDEQSTRGLKNRDAHHGTDAKRDPPWGWPPDTRCVDPASSFWRGLIPDAARVHKTRLSRRGESEDYSDSTRDGRDDSACLGPAHSSRLRATSQPRTCAPPAATRSAFALASPASLSPMGVSHCARKAFIARIVAQGHIEPRSNAAGCRPRYPAQGAPPRIKSGAPKIYKPVPLGGRAGGRSESRSNWLVPTIQCSPIWERISVAPRQHSGIKPLAAGGTGSPRSELPNCPAAEGLNTPPSAS